MAYPFVVALATVSEWKYNIIMYANILYRVRNCLFCMPFAANNAMTGMSPRRQNTGNGAKYQKIIIVGVDFIA